MHSAPSALNLEIHMSNRRKFLLAAAALIGSTVGLGAAASVSRSAGTQASECECPCCCCDDCACESCTGDCGDCGCCGPGCCEAAPDCGSGC